MDIKRCESYGFDDSDQVFLNRIGGLINNKIANMESFLIINQIDGQLYFWIDKNFAQFCNYLSEDNIRISQFVLNNSNRFLIEWNK